MVFCHLAQTLINLECLPGLVARLFNIVYKDWLNNINSTIKYQQILTNKKSCQVIYFIEDDQNQLFFTTIMLLNYEVIQCCAIA